MARSHSEFRSSSRRSAGNLQPVEDDPESILRRARKSRRLKAVTDNRLTETLAIGYPSGLARSIENTPPERNQSIYESTSEYPNNGTSSSSQDIDPVQKFYRHWGYLPPLDEEAVALFDFIIANPDMAPSEFGRIGPENLEFVRGLQWRNVFLDESKTIDPMAKHIKQLSLEDPTQETDGEKESHGMLWAMDQEKCQNGSNEALFQRTLMMSLIARHCLIYERQSSNVRYLDFSVEEAWTCPPMPSRAYIRGAKFLTQPKPDLAVCFYRPAVIPDHLWNEMPSATQCLACYENINRPGIDRVFHFLTIEAKRANTSSNDDTGKHQSLNNASQALHNMFEFFRDAGSEHEEKFFDRVRFFSVVANAEGLMIRIHRATREPKDGLGQGFIMPDKPEYPLRFEHQEYCRVQKESFGRKTVFETFERILIGYGVRELRCLLEKAAEALMAGLRDNYKAGNSRNDNTFYRHGQTDIPRSRKATPRGSLAPSVTNRSVNMRDSPGRAETMTPIQPPSSFSKRPREPSEESIQARKKSAHGKV